MKPKPPKFEGETPDACALKLSGTTEDRIGAMTKGEEFFLIVRGRVTGVDHRDIRDVPTRIHKGRPTAMVWIDRAKGEQMLEEASMLADELFGITHLFNDGEGAGGQ